MRDARDAWRRAPCRAPRGVAVAVGQATPRPASCRRWPATSTSTLPTRRADLDRVPSARPRAARSSGCMSSWCRGRPLVSRSVLCIQELLSRWCRRPISSSSSAPAGRRRPAEPGEVGQHQRRGEVDPPVRASAAGRAGTARSGPRSTPSGALRQRARPRAGAPPVRSSRSTIRVGESRSRRLRSTSRAAASGWLRPRAPAISRERRGRGRSPSRGARPRASGSTAGVNRAVLRTASAWNDQVVVVALQRGRRRQDHVGVPGGLVEVDVDRDHEVQPGERLVQPRAVGGGRAPGCRRPSAAPRTWPSPGVSDLVGQRRDRQLAADLGQAAHPAAPPVVVAAADQAAAPRRRRRGR